MSFKQIAARYGASLVWHVERSRDLLRGDRPVPGEERFRRLRDYVQNANGAQGPELGVIAVPNIDARNRRESYRGVQLLALPKEYSWDEHMRSAVALRMYEELSGILWAPLGPLPAGPDGNPIPYNHAPRDAMIMALPLSERILILLNERTALKGARNKNESKKSLVRKLSDLVSDMNHDDSSSGEDSETRELYNAATMEAYCKRRLAAIARMVDQSRAEESAQMNAIPQYDYTNQRRDPSLPPVRSPVMYSWRHVHPSLIQEMEAANLVFYYERFRRYVWQPGRRPSRIWVADSHPEWVVDPQPDLDHDARWPYQDQFKVSPTPPVYNVLRRDSVHRPIRPPMWFDGLV